MYSFFSSEFNLLEFYKKSTRKKSTKKSTRILRKTKQKIYKKSTRILRKNQQKIYQNSTKKSTKKRKSKFVEHFENGMRPPHVTGDEGAPIPFSKYSTNLDFHFFCMFCFCRILVDFFVGFFVEF